jgi:asparagine synthetase B (glutamine-hydrolysing)
MEMILNHNFRTKDIADGDFRALYEKRRRDANFALVFVDQTGRTIALRDHLGIVPLFYRFRNGTYQFSTHLENLVTGQDIICHDGLKSYLAFGTARLKPLFKEIGIVPPGTVLVFNPETQQPQVVYQYQIAAQDVTGLKTFQDYVVECRQLMKTALERTVRTDKIGLLLSGGIDSGIIGFLLRELGIAINAYTIGAWGKTSSDIVFARENAKLLGVATHQMDYLETEDYAPAMKIMPQCYQMPHGTRAALSVMMLWERTGIGQESQLIFGQNADTMTGAMGTQYSTYFLSKLPRFIRQRYDMPYNDIIRNFLSFVSKGHVVEAQNVPLAVNTMSDVEKLIVTGMLLAHTPSDSEVFVLPAMQTRVPIVNPYYDMDLVEFFLGVPIQHRLKFSPKSRPPLQFEKRILQHVALEWLPKHVAQRKKALTVSFDRDEHSRNLLAQLPLSIETISLYTLEQRFAAASLQQWFEYHGLNNILSN